MGKLKILLLALIVLGIGYAATCASKSYSTSCSKCTFDADGKMDKECYEKYQGSGVACLFTAYPVESIKYKMGSCPAIDTCRDRLETCKAIYSSGNDILDCEAGSLDNCFVQSDVCVAMAVKNCDEPPPEQPAFDAPPVGWCDSVFFLVLPLLGAVWIRKK